MTYNCLCGHLLALPKGALADLGNHERVQIWCVKCGRINYVTGNSCKTGGRVNKAIVKTYEHWR